MKLGWLALIASVPMILSASCARGIGKSGDETSGSLEALPYFADPGTGGDDGVGGNYEPRGGSGGGSSSCTPDEVHPCTTGCGSQGTKSCNSTGSWDNCTPPSVEIDCENNIDDDCDGALDGADPDCTPNCTPNAVQQCSTACGSIGTKTCSSTGVWGTCNPPSHETDCNNGIDDDCDGNVDTDDSECPEEDCSDTNGGNCNSDDGHGDVCDPIYNYNCSAEKFWAWCNRRNDAYPNIWDNWVYNWVDSHCDGDIWVVDPTGHPQYHCTDSNRTTYSCQTPLVLVFDPATPVEFQPSEHTFAIEPTAAPVSTDWPSAATPWLALDRNGNGLIDDGSELFGSGTKLSTGARAHQGFEALRELDDNGDGVVDTQDSAWSHLVAWADSNNDGISQPSEMQLVTALGLERIDLGYSVSPRCDNRGNCERERSGLVWHDAQGNVRQGEVVDVYLRTRAPQCVAP
jgi:hypothetical protein